MNSGKMYLLFFDLPVQSKLEKKAAAKFRRSLIKDGYYSLQESVYIKYIPNSNIQSEVTRVYSFSPNYGSIYLLPLSISSFSKIKNIVGPEINIPFYTDEYLII